VSHTGLLDREKTVAIQRVTRVGKILIFIPVLFVLIRIWSVIQYFYTTYLTGLTDVSGQCIPSSPYQAIYVSLGIFQVKLLLCMMIEQ